MKTLLKLSFFLTLFLTGTQPVINAQLQPFSPPAHTEQLVGNTNVTIDFTRPIARGRKIFGGLVKYGELWSTGGGGGNPIIRFDGQVTIGDQEVPAGSYSLLTIPGEKEWTILLNRNTDKFGFVEYTATKDVVQICVPVTHPGRFYEALSLELDLMHGSGRLYLSWTDVQVSIPITTSSPELEMDYIDSLIAAPLSDDHDVYFRAAQYLLFTKRDVQKVIPITDYYLKLQPGEYAYRLRIKAYVHLGKKQKALEAVEQGITATRAEYVNRPNRLKAVLQHFEEERERVNAF